MKKQSKRETAVQRLERQYAELVQQVRLLGWRVPIPDDSVSLEQPSPLLIVDTVTTYGAYEKPV